MDNQELVREYNRAISNKDYIRASYYLEKLSKPKEINPDWIDIIREFNRRLDYDRK